MVNAEQRLQRAFRVKTVKYGWDKDTGISIDFDFENYVEARYGGSVK